MSKASGTARRARLAAGAAAAMAAAMVAGAPAQAITITFTYDPSLNSLPNASLIKSDLNSVAQYFDHTLTSPVTVDIYAGWGEVDNRAIPSGDVSSSVDNLFGYFTYSQMKGYLTTAAKANPADTALVSAAAHLPASAPAGVANYAIPSAEAKALGVIPGYLPTVDGYIGFNKATAWDFASGDGVSTGTYDFEAAAAHEITEVLGRLSGLTSANPGFRMPLDLYRYSAPGQAAFNYWNKAYFSVDGGVTNLGAFNVVSGGDRSDWTWTGSDAQSAYLHTGKKDGLTVADLTALDALGWGGTNIGDTKMLTPTLTAQAFMGAAVPEPATWALTILGLGLIGAALRRRKAPALA